MEKLFILSFLLVFLSNTIFSQEIIVKLNINLPPEFGFSISKSDTTVLKGTSVVLGTDITLFDGSGEYSFSWSPGKSLSDSTIMNPEAIPDDTTTYELTVVDNYGCSFSVNYTVNVRQSPVSADFTAEQKISLTAKLFPNPNDGKFRVELIGAPQDEISLVIIDNAGKAIHQKDLKNFTGNHTETLDIKLPAGVYILMILGNNDKLQRQFIIN